LAKRVVPNIAGLAPRAEYSGIIIGLNIAAKTGAKAITPTIASAKAPHELKPSSNSFPTPSIALPKNPNPIF